MNKNIGLKYINKSIWIAKQQALLCLFKLCDNSNDGKNKIIFGLTLLHAW